MLGRPNSGMVPGAVHHGDEGALTNGPNQCFLFSEGDGDTAPVHASRMLAIEA